MNVVIKLFNGREVIPVRALPFLSDRKTMSPDVVAKVFAGKNELGRFVGLCAYRLEDGVVMRIAERWWQTGPCQKLAALSSTIQAEQHPGEHETEEEYKARHERELAKWRDKSPGLLPAGAFVFKDEFEQIYSNEFKYGYYHFKGDDGKFLSEPDHIKRIALDYLPFVDDATAALVLAGFENYQTPNNGTSRAHTNPATVSQVTPMQVPELEQVPPNSPVVNAGALGGTATVWTAERKEAARAMMNEQRGQGIRAFAANTAAAFGVTPTRLREVLNDKPKKAPARKAKGYWDV